MKNYPTLPDNETLPVQSARALAFLTVAMSLGFVAVLFFFFLKGAFVGITLWGVVAAMSVLALFSSLRALKRLMPKMRCPNCSQPFFTHVRALFAKPVRCAACQQRLQSEDNHV